MNIPNLSILSPIQTPSIEEFQKMIQSDSSETQIQAFAALGEHPPEALKAGLSAELAKKVDNYAKERQKQITQAARAFMKLTITKEELYESKEEFQERREILNEIKEIYKSLRYDLHDPLEELQQMNEKISKKLAKVPDERCYCCVSHPTHYFSVSVESLKNTIIFVQKYPRESLEETFSKNLKDALEVGTTIEEIEKFIKEQQYEMADEILALIKRLTSKMNITPPKNPQNKMTLLKVHFRALNYDLIYYKRLPQEEQKFIQQLQTCLEFGVKEERLREIIQKTKRTFIDTPEELLERYHQEDKEAEQHLLNLFDTELPKIKEKLPEILRQKEEARAKAKAEREARMAENRGKLTQKVKTFLDSNEEMHKHPEYENWMRQKEDVKFLIKKVAAFCSLEEMQRQPSLSEEAKLSISHYYQRLSHSV